MKSNLSFWICVRCVSNIMNAGDGGGIQKLLGSIKKKLMSIPTIQGKNLFFGIKILETKIMPKYFSRLSEIFKCRRDEG